MREPMARVAVDGGELETLVLGSGEPVLLVPTALTADELLPLARRLAVDRTVVHFHRRGYGGSSPAARPGSVEGEAADCARLLEALRIRTADVVGVSYSAAVALGLAAARPDLVRTLTLVEPPPVHGPHDADFRLACAALLEDRRARGAEAAVVDFLLRTTGPSWRTALESAVPGSPDQAVRDGRTFLDTDLPALLRWSFDAAAAARVLCPVLHVAGSAHGPLFDGVADLVRAWLPHAVQVEVDGAGHDVALTHLDALVDVLVPFLAPRPPPGAGTRAPDPRVGSAPGLPRRAVAGAHSGMALDPLVTNPGSYRLVFENDRVRVLEYQDSPGHVTDPHAHPDSVMVTLSDFTRRLHSGGRTRDVELAAGQALWLPAQEHHGENTGRTPTHTLFVELKEPAPTAAAGPAPALGPAGP